VAETYAFFGLVNGVRVPVSPAEASEPGALRPRILLTDAPSPAYLDPHDARTIARLDLFEESVAARCAVYLSIDRSTDQVASVSFPFIGLVSAVEPRADGSREVHVRPSPIRYRLPPEHPEFARIVADLEDARLGRRLIAIVENDETVDIVDVRPVPAGTQATPFPPAFPQRMVRPEADRRREPFSMASLTILERDVTESAEDVFTRLERVGCGDRITARDRTCIPFTYPDSGCHARAHRMCELMLERGIVAGKIWSFGNLWVRTPNSPRCRVPWRFHVAPVVRIEAGAGEALRVLDPALFDAPVSRRRWLEVQSDPEAETELTDASVWEDPDEHPLESDPGFVNTPEDLDPFRRSLRARIAERGGPPPYCRR